MQETKSMYDEAHEITKKIHKYEEQASQLQTASDYLTEQVRLFAITGKKEHLDNYFREAKVDKRRDNAVEALKVEHKNSNAFWDLQTALNGSRLLMIMEYHAARLAVDAYGYNINDFPEEIRVVQLPKNEAALTPQGKGELAKEILFNEEYTRQKQFISDHMISCLVNLEKEIWEKQEDGSIKLKEQLFIEHALTVLLIIVLIVVAYMISQMVIFPLQDFVDLIRNDEELPEKGASEIRFLAETYNSIRETNIRNREQLNYDATHDKLTTLYNRRGMELVVDDIDLSHAAVLMVDLDKFKDINDTYGHDVGDKVLIKVANTLLEHFSKGHVCRLGGDEFVVILENTTPAMRDELTKEIGSINRMLKAGRGGIPPVSVSVGVSFCNGNMNVKTMLKRADDSLYEAKEGGRSDIRFSEPSITT